MCFILEEDRKEKNTQKKQNNIKKLFERAAS